MKKTTIVSLVFIIAAFLIGYGLGTQKQEGVKKENGVVEDGGEVEKKELIKIGVIASLTGKGASRGESARQGLELAMKTIKDDELLKDYEIKLFYQDAPTVGGTKEAISAFNQLTQVKKVNAIIGPMGSPTAIAVAPLVDGVKIPVIMHTASAVNITENNAYVFRLWPTAQSYVDVITFEVNKRGYQKIAALSSQTENTIDLLNLLKDKISFSIDEQVTPDTNDFRTQLVRIKELNVDAIFLNLHEGQIGLAAKQARELGLQMPLFSNAVMSAVELEQGAEALEEIWYPRFTGYKDKIRQEFIDIYGKEPSDPDSAAAAHDALIALSQAINETGTVDSAQLKDYLYSHDFNGSIGKFRFLENGDAQISLTIKTVKNKAIIDLEQ